MTVFTIKRMKDLKGEIKTETSFTTKDTKENRSQAQGAKLKGKTNALFVVGFPQPIA